MATFSAVMAPILLSSQRDKLGLEGEEGWGLADLVITVVLWMCADQFRHDILLRLSYISLLESGTSSCTWQLHGRAAVTVTKLDRSKLFAHAGCRSPVHFETSVPTYMHPCRNQLPNPASVSTFSSDKGMTQSAPIRHPLQTRTLKAKECRRDVQR
jgi:hypothetical protein